MKNVLYIVVPCYNEQEVLPETARRLKEKIQDLTECKLIDKESRIVFVNDGSKDQTWNLIEKLYMEDSLYCGVNLSRNRGHQNALLAGLSVAVQYADMMITLDADLQDDINAIDGMVRKFQEGYEIVYGVRSSRKKDTFFKRFTAEGYYKVLKILGVDIVFNHADYRLMSKRAVEGLMEFEEVNLFLRGIVPQIGYKSATVTYERAERFAGESKYPLKKMIAFALEGITSFSVKPLKFIANLGMVVCLISLGMFIWSIVQHFLGHTVEGWSSIMVSIWFLGGVQLTSLGVIGEYIGKIYGETKRRPKFIIETVLHDKKGE
ncbi:MAG: glycosyltransferase family 2 protein [Lachnospiraceae bacterium]|nr:glycosyltransferase family 2 protein [Lachnospiraceae bacterium]